ncbi:hypothetical protein ZIOFF_042482 [Zingiber officinale]|uniref:Vta1/callose synthase N-terminal domain-containing protein n=1 Tax=Zingiber officinale TaxID=94328 RepID=A0A8J5FUV7_ZINOF|nr:hypothetical protein ZIOFF_042482 [Zingiber officinale]
MSPSSSHGRGLVPFDVAGEAAGGLVLELKKGPSPVSGPSGCTNTPDNPGGTMKTSYCLLMLILLLAMSPSSSHGRHLVPFDVAGEAAGVLVLELKKGSSPGSGASGCTNTPDNPGGDKKTLQLGPQDNLYVEGFASNLFAKADKQDRAGRADLLTMIGKLSTSNITGINTAKTFYAASIFFEILYQFGGLQPEIEQKQKYAVWKAADIRKALKEGRKPEPGPPGGDPDQSISSGLSSYTYVCSITCIS